jgi:glycosyltransferase involved in cell wall biosynthesis
MRVHSRRERFTNDVRTGNGTLLRSTLRNALNTLALRRKRSLVEEALFRAACALSPARARVRAEALRPFLERRRVRILSFDEDNPDEFLRLCSGDHWVRYELTAALGRMGYMVTDREPDVALHLFGEPAELPDRAYKIIWIYSHPERVTPELLRRYDKIFCLSSEVCERIRAMGFEVEFAPGATTAEPLERKPVYDIVFVGNARSDQDGGREIIRDLGETPHNLKVWGRQWEGILPEKHFGGLYLDYRKLPMLYSAAKIALCDHRREMREQGFVAVRVFEILASGGFCISDANTGLAEIFGDAVPQYHTPEELQALVEHYLNDENARRACMEEGRRIAREYTWEARARQFMAGMPARLVSA